MTQATSQASETAQLPTIIIDPSLYHPDAPLPKQTPRRGLGRLARVTLLTGAVGGATVGLAHLLPHDSFSQDVRVAALTKLLGYADNDPAPHPLPPSDRSASVAQPAKSAASVARPITVQAMPADSQPPLAAVASEPPALAAAEPKVPPPASRSNVALSAASVNQLPQPTLKRPAQLAKGPLVAATQPASAARVDLEASIRGARRLQALNQLDEAEAAYQAVLAQSAGQSAALVGLARIKLSRGQLDAALELAQRAVREAPDQANVHLTMGDVLRARGDKPGAEAEYALAGPK